MQYLSADGTNHNSVFVLTMVDVNEELERKCKGATFSAVKCF